MAKRALVTLLTDFGTGGPYVAAMKGAILRRCALARVVDICESISDRQAGHIVSAVNFNAPGQVVIAGHGAEYFSEFVNNPIRVTILRDPVELFFSQYQYLKNSPNSIFQKEISKLRSIEEYLDFAIENGQDNLMTRYLSNSIDWLFDLTKRRYCHEKQILSSSHTDHFLSFLCIYGMRWWQRRG